MNATKTCEILGIGTPILDHLLKVSDQFLDTVPGKKHGMETVSFEEMIHIIESSGKTPMQIAGGSAANAIKGLASLGRACALTGKIGEDSIGEKVIEDLQDLGITPLLHYSSTPTAHVTCLITPDGLRTCRSYMGAGGEMSPEDLLPEHFEGKKLVHIEGYSLLCPGLTFQAMQLAKLNNALISFDLGSFEIITSFKPLILDLLKDFVDILFANEDEAIALTEKTPEEACKELSSLCEVVVVMMGAKGCYVGSEGEVYQCPAYPVTPIDTTGAGDLFASGFLHGYLSGQPLEECARWGAITGGEAVQIIGAEIPKNKWSEILTKMQPA